MLNRILKGNIITEEQAFFGTLRIEDKRIANVEKQGELQSEANWITPGFIDVHTHGIGPYTAVSGEGAQGMATFAPPTGLTGVCPTLAAESPEKLLAFVKEVAELVKSPDPNITKIIGSHLEGPFIDYTHRGGMDKRLVRGVDLEEARFLLDAADGTLKLMTISPEVDGAESVITLMSRAGVTVSIGHTGCSKEQKDMAVSAGATQVCHLFDTFDGRVVEHGVSKPCLADCVLIDDRLQKELICDGIHVPQNLITLAHRAAGAEHLIAITDSLAGAGLPPGSTFPMTDGRMMFMSDVARLVDNPECIVGSCLTMDKVFRNLITRFGFTPVEAAMMTATNPAKSCHEEHIRGSLKVGLFADIVVVSPEFDVEETILEGNTIYSK
ncbi:MAG: amidohydrolase family protein [Victivallales bacterium]|nr:amidohydrolase family protein [Victivallales bacterium]